MKWMKGGRWCSPGVPDHHPQPEDIGQDPLQLNQPPGHQNRLVLDKAATAWTLACRKSPSRPSMSKTTAAWCWRSSRTYRPSLPGGRGSSSGPRSSSSSSWGAMRRKTVVEKTFFVRIIIHQHTVCHLLPLASGKEVGSRTWPQRNLKQCGGTLS